MTGKSDFTFFHPLRVRWAECDGQGIVFNANYFVYYDIGVWEWTRALGFSKWQEAPQFVTAHAECDFKASATFDDELEIGVRAARLGRKSMEVATALFRGEELLATGKLNYVYVKHNTVETAPLPGELVERIVNFERVIPSFIDRYRSMKRNPRFAAGAQSRLPGFNESGSSKPGIKPDRK